MLERATSLLDAAHAFAVDRAPLLATIGGISAVLSILGILLLPFAVRRLPADHFSRMASIQAGHLPSPRSHPFTGLLRTIVGLAVVLMGIALCLLPGQGLLTILLGLLILRFPGRRRLILSIVSRPAVLRTLNWIRQRGDRPPFGLQSDGAAS